MAWEEARPIELKFTAVDGTEVDIDRMRGKVVLIDFWASWCHYCESEVPYTVAAYDKYHNKDFEIIGVTLDNFRWMLTPFRNAIGWCGHNIATAKCGRAT